MTRQDAPVAPPDRVARHAERLLRAAGDPRLALGLLLLAALANAIAAAAPDGPRLLAIPAYGVLLGAIVLTGTAAVAVRLPAAWREWRRPGALPAAADVFVAELALPMALASAQRAKVVAQLRAAGYRTADAAGGAQWTAHATRHGWTRLAALGSHLALVLVLVGAATSAAFASETTFSLLVGEQALLDAPRPGFGDAVRLERFDAAFGADGRPVRLDTEVTFLRGSRPVQQQTIQVNRPGSFGGYLVHGWTYGPAVELRVETLAGRPLLDGPIPLDGLQAGRPATLVDLPVAEATIGIVLVSAVANELAVTVAGSGGIVDVVSLRPGRQERTGDLVIELHRFSSYVTFLSRRDPGMGLLFAGAGALTIALAAALWLPRRRVSVSEHHDPHRLRVRMRGERFDHPAPDLDRVVAAIERALR